MRRAALFIDFDNVQSSIQDIYGREIAEEVGNNPGKLISWIERGLHQNGPIETGAKSHAVLVRRCYLNPASFGRFRAAFTRAGISVVDCPPLTGRGKNSSDILMVLDILDTLAHRTHFDEFVILSMDADFTPVLVRLREHDRSCAVLTDSWTSAAYRASADSVIDLDRLLRDAYGIQLDTEEEDLGAVLEDIRLVVKNIVRGYGGPVAVTDLLVELRSRFSNGINAFANADAFLKFFATLDLRGIQPSPDGRFLQMDATAALSASPPAPTPAKPPTVEGHRTDDYRSAPPSPDLDHLRKLAAQHVWDMLARNVRPVAMVDVSNALHAQLPVRETEWFGLGGFKAFLTWMNNPMLGMITDVPPGFLYDTARHSRADIVSDHGIADFGSDVAFRSDDDPFRRVLRLTGAPLMHAEDYRLAFNALARTISKSRPVANTVLISKEARDLLAAEGTPMGRSHLNFIVVGLRNFAPSLIFEGGGEVLSIDIARVFANNLRHLCDGMQYPLSREEEEAIVAALALHDPALTTEASDNEGVSETTPPVTPPDLSVSDGPVPPLVADPSFAGGDRFFVSDGPSEPLT